jgi:Uma2 family endonuclease
MPLASPPSSPQAWAPAPTLEPLRLPWDLRLTPEQFEQVCRDNPDAVLELDADGQLIAMTPTGGETGARNNALLFQLNLAIRRGHLDLKVFDSSTGFRLADGSVLSPDAAVVERARWEALSPEQRRGFPPLCPDLVVELASTSDEGPRGVSALRHKMDRYRANGARIGWLLLPAEQAVEVWRVGAAGVPCDRLENVTRLNADELYPGLELELAEIWGV